MIGIVGGGITGLTIAHHLRRLGVEHVVLEADAEPGGVIQTVRHGGVPLEWGPQRTRLTPELQRLLDDLDLNDRLITAPPGLPIFVYRGGRLHQVPIRPASALTSDLISLPAKVRLLLEPLTGGARPQETVEEYFCRKMGREPYEAMLGPLFGGLYATDPSRMLVRHALDGLLRQLGVKRSLLRSWMRARGAAGRSPACSFEDGMATLPRALAAANQENVRLSTSVRRVSRDAAGRFRIETDDDSIPVCNVVFTSSAEATADCIQDVAPDSAGRLRGLTYNPLAMIYLDAVTPLVGFGYQVAFGESLETRGVTWNASLFARPDLYTAFLGGMKNPELVELPANRLGQIAADEFERVTGYEARVLSVNRTRIPAWDVTWRGLDGLALPPGIRICSNYLDRPGIPGRLRQAEAVALELAGAERAPVAT
jgi:oxygen-dependent protoporphyrinogen oxidase